MDIANTSPTDRRRIARTAIDALEGQRSDHALVRVKCPASHNVATVYRTSQGPVFVTARGTRAHGSRDFVDTAHHGGNHDSEYVDLLEATQFDDDQLPAQCPCGAFTLSRKELQQAVRSHTRTLSLS